MNALAHAALNSARFVTSSGHARSNCPFCPGRVGKEDKKQCLAISTTSGWYNCWRCGITGRLDGEEFTTDAPQLSPQEKVVMGPPEGFYELGTEPGFSAISFEDAREYLSTPIGKRTSWGEKGRGLADPAVWRAAHIGATYSGRAAGRVVVPLLSPEGQWWGWVGRCWTPGSERPYLNATGMTLGTDGHLFNHAALLVKTEKPVLVMEGVFDALAYWPDAVAVLGKPTEPQLSALSATPRPVAVVLDGDAWREGEMLSLKLRLEGQRAGHVRLAAGVDPDELPDKSQLWQQAEESLNQ